MKTSWKNFQKRLLTINMWRSLQNKPPYTKLHLMIPRVLCLESRRKVELAIYSDCLVNSNKYATIHPTSFALSVKTKQMPSAPVILPKPEIVLHSLPARPYLLFLFLHLSPFVVMLPATRKTITPNPSNTFNISVSLSSALSFLSIA